MGKEGKERSRRSGVYGNATKGTAERVEKS